VSGENDLSLTIDLGQNNTEDIYIHESTDLLPNEDCKFVLYDIWGNPSLT